MKTKILGSMVAVVITAIAATNVNFSTPNSKMSTINLSNVEALASGEDSLCDDRCEPNGNGCFCDIWCPAYYEKF